jgi:hypothetical protein
MVAIALKMIEYAPDKICENFVVSYFEECEYNECPDRMGLLLKNTSLARGIIYSVLNQRFSLLSLPVILNHTVIQHIGLFSFLTAEESIRLALRYTQVVNSDFLQLPVLRQPTLSESFLNTADVEEAMDNYKQSLLILDEAMMPM